MGFWNWGRGDTKKDDSVVVVDYKKKYKKLRAAHKSLIDECRLVAESAQSLMSEESAMRFVVFATVMQCGGKLELTKETIKIARDSQPEYEIEFRENNGSFTCTAKRKEATA